MTVQISSAHHGAINLKKYRDRNEPAPVAVSFGHHPIYLVIGGIGIPYRVSEYAYLGAMFGEPVAGGLWEGDRASNSGRQ